MKSQPNQEQLVAEWKSKWRALTRERHRATNPKRLQRAGTRASKPTQTHLKAVRRFGDLLYDGQFLAELWDIGLDENSEERGARLYSFAERYALDLYENSPFRQLINTQNPDTSDPNFGYCHVVDEAMEVLENPDRDYYEANPALSRAQRHRFILYPVHISLSPLATKREVMDYVAKSWPEIRVLLDTYQASGPRLRERHKSPRDVFIWQHRDLRRRVIADMVNAKFPGESQTYATVQAILQRLKVQFKEWPHFD